MAEEQMLSGEGWISDDSSFYGDEDTQEHQHSLCEDFNPKPFWSAHHKDLNIIKLATRRHQHEEAVLTNQPVSMKIFAPYEQANLKALAATPSKPFGISSIDRKAMEKERLARLEGHPNHWQLGESADDFVKRVPPLITSAFTYDWIWVGNPHRNARDKSTSSRVNHFIGCGIELLDQSLQTRRDIQAKGYQEPRGMITRLLNQASKALQQCIVDLAVEANVLSGKWMLFPKLDEVTRMWKLAIQGVVDNRLGPMAKVTTNNGSDERLICVYTRDFRDAEDVLRVLQGLETLGLLNSGRTLYYKPDAYTYLDLKSTTAVQHGLQASLYNSRTMMAASTLPKSSSLAQKTYSTLDKHFWPPIYAAVDG